METLSILLSKLDSAGSLAVILILFGGALLVIAAIKPPIKYKEINLFFTTRWRIGLFVIGTLALLPAIRVATFSVQLSQLPGDAFVSTSWLTSEDYQNVFDAFKNLPRYYPKKIIGKADVDGDLFRSDWGVLPSDQIFNWIASHGISISEFKSKNADLTNKGFELFQHDAYTSFTGEKRFNAVWIHKEYKSASWTPPDNTTVNQTPLNKAAQY